jgi:hypothetical protein
MPFRYSDAEQIKVYMIHTPCIMQMEFLIDSARIQMMYTFYTGLVYTFDTPYRSTPSRFINFTRLGRFTPSIFDA